MKLYRENLVPDCPHTQLLNRGAPPNTSNQRVCDYCRKAFSPPKIVGGVCIAEDGEEAFDK